MGNFGVLLMAVLALAPLGFAATAAQGQEQGIIVYIAPASIPSGTSGVPYSVRFAAYPPQQYWWNVSGLPPGMRGDNEENTLLVHGTPKQAGSYVLRISVTEGSSWASVKMPLRIYANKFVSDSAEIGIAEQKGCAVSKAVFEKGKLVAALLRCPPEAQDSLNHTNRSAPAADSAKPRASESYADAANQTNRTETAEREACPILPTEVDCPDTGAATTKPVWYDSNGCPYACKKSYESPSVPAVEATKTKQPPTGETPKKSSETPAAAETGGRKAESPASSTSPDAASSADSVANAMVDKSGDMYAKAIILVGVYLESFRK